MFNFFILLHRCLISSVICNFCTWFLFHFSLRRWRRRNRALWRSVPECVGLVFQTGSVGRTAPRSDGLNPAYNSRFWGSVTPWNLPLLWLCWSLCPGPLYYTCLSLCFDCSSVVSKRILPVSLSCSHFVVATCATEIPHQREYNALLYLLNRVSSRLWALIKAQQSELLTSSHLQSHICSSALLWQCYAAVGVHHKNCDESDDYFTHVAESNAEKNKECGDNGWDKERKERAKDSALLENLSKLSQNHFIIASPWGLSLSSVQLPTSLSVSVSPSLLCSFSCSSLYLSHLLITLKLSLSPSPPLYCSLSLSYLTSLLLLLSFSICAPLSLTLLYLSCYWQSVGSEGGIDLTLGCTPHRAV